MGLSKSSTLPANPIRHVTYPNVDLAWQREIEQLGLNMRHVVGLGLLGSLGFTMSIFIRKLGFAGMPLASLTAKIGIVIASMIGGISGCLWLRFFK